MLFVILLICWFSPYAGERRFSKKLNFRRFYFLESRLPRKLSFWLCWKVETSVLLSATAEELSSRGLFTLFDSKRYKPKKVSNRLDNKFLAADICKNTLYRSKFVGEIQFWQKAVTMEKLLWLPVLKLLAL